MQPLDQIIKEAIAHHRAEIVRLERALAAYVDVAAPTPQANGSRVRLTEDAKQRVRTSKYEPLFRAFANEGRPLTNDEMLRISIDQNFPIDRGNLRSIVHNQKSLGRARPVGDGYVWNMEPASSSTPAGEEETGGLEPPASFTDFTGHEREGSTQDAPCVGGT